MKVLVSACFLGVKCKYNGGDNRNEAVIQFCRDKDVIAVCPEIRAGMPCPRIPAEIMNGKVIDKKGKDVDAIYRNGVARVMKDIQHQKIELAILKSRSPTCGVHEIYDGTFSGTCIPGEGLLAEALRKQGIPVIDEKEVERKGKKR
ncbi:hypothetical protein HMPREF3191_00205 [Veillonellaceae bacterium DNF00626]|nr:hypothetical protein HMPREF3191_00205 [Veillonellaceae bacterium DNF00626]